jgi:DNA invertase Pin-like site-specific DNA recombinase
MKAVLYLRVSTNEARQDVENQREPLLNLAKAMNLEIINEYVDYASGGNSNRPQFQKMLADAKKHEFSIVLVWALDRFSREGIINTLHYLNSLSQSNVALKSLQESWLDTRDKGIGQLLIAIFSWVAEQERLRLSERIKAGLKGKKNVGKRGKDKNRRKKSGYYLRWQGIKKRPPKKTRVVIEDDKN